MKTTPIPNNYSLFRTNYSDICQTTRQLLAFSGKLLVLTFNYSFITTIPDSLILSENYQNLMMAGVVVPKNSYYTYYYTIICELHIYYTMMAAITLCQLLGYLQNYSPTTRFFRRTTRFYFQLLIFYNYPG